MTGSRRFWPGWPAAILSALLCLRSPSLAASGGGQINEKNTVLINVTEADLNRLLLATFRSHGGPLFEGTQQSPSKGISNLSYHVEVSEPVVKLGLDGKVRVSFAIRDARLDIGRLERKVGKRMAFCENAGVTMDTARPVEVSLGFHLAIANGVLRILPDDVNLSDPGKSFRFVKPTRCQNTVLPTWFVWWIGKNRLKHRLGTLDKVLMDDARKKADRLNEGGGLFKTSLMTAGSSPAGAPGRSDGDEKDGDERGEGSSSGHLLRDRENGSAEAPWLELFPSFLETSRGSMFLSLTDGPGSERSGAEAEMPAWALERSNRSFVAVSDEFLNTVSRALISRITAGPIRGRGDFDKLLKSDAFPTLVPGLRGLVEGKDKLYVTLTATTPPSIELGRVGSERSLDGWTADGSIPDGSKADESTACGSTACGSSETGSTAIGSTVVGSTPYGVLAARSSAEHSAPHRLTPNAPMPESPIPAGSGQARKDLKAAANPDGGPHTEPDMALIRIKVSGIELHVWRAKESGDEQLGTLRVESGRIGVVPYPNPLGGISFDVVENDWRVSSSGAEFDEELIESILQEVVFAQAFETRYSPLLRNGLGIGEAKLTPRAFSVVDDHLVIDLGEPREANPVPMRTGNLPGSR